MAGNYDKQALMARDLFLKYDQQDMIAKFQLDNDGNYIYIQLLDRMYRILREDGSVEVYNKGNLNEEDAFSSRKEARDGTEQETPAVYEQCMDFNIVMTIYDILCYSKETPILAREWCPLAMLQITSSPSADIFTKKYAEIFSGKIDELWKVCKRIGGRKPEIMAGADVCWEFDLFPFFPVQFRYWDKDEEFPPQIKLLWDKNSLKFMHFETMYYAMGILLERIAYYLKSVTV